ncbi:hypothetical protein HHK36_011732 [Tetracentron sinense]|uniref:Gnk2-homologous domain-containing protein n=1 Tax=Tetracentron sinense TaxID=13715 RepID=A0A834ZEC3_TETSI|nr:hypothetical protein HHK36_011732 [Tetracentron sinense]
MMRRFELLFLLSGLLTHLGFSTSQLNYLHHFCSGASYANDSAFGVNVNLLLSPLTSKVIHDGYYKTTMGWIPDSVYGDFLCRGDVTIEVCRNCIIKASEEIVKRCSMQNGAVIWFDECMLHYSNINYFGVIQMALTFKNYTQSNSQQHEPEISTIQTAISELILKAQKSPMMFAAEKLEATEVGTRYGLVQCTRDLSSDDCSTCLRLLTPYIKDCCEGKPGGRLLTPSCNMRYEDYSFYQETINATPPDADTDTTNKAKTLRIAIITTAAILAAMLLGSCFYYLRFSKIMHRFRKIMHEGGYAAAIAVMSLLLVGKNRETWPTKGFFLQEDGQAPSRRILFGSRPTRDSEGIDVDPSVVGISVGLSVGIVEDDGISYDTGNYTTNSTYQINLNLLLSTLSTNASLNDGFYNATGGRNSDKVYALTLCRGDVAPDVCANCVNTSSHAIIQQCPNQKEAIIGYDECMLRYSNTSMFSVMDQTHILLLLNTKNFSDADQLNKVLGDLMNGLVTRASSGSSSKKFAVGEAKVTDFQKVYGLAQCTPDISQFNCEVCLQGSVGDIPNYFFGKEGGRVIKTSCNLRYELYPFYTSTAAAPPPSPPVNSPPPPLTNTTTPDGKGNSSPIVVIIIVSTVIGVILLCIISLFLWRRKPKEKVEGLGVCGRKLPLFIATRREDLDLDLLWGFSDLICLRHHSECTEVDRQVSQTKPKCSTSCHFGNLQEEQEAIGKCKEKVDEDKFLYWAGTKKMPMTSRVIKETLRVASILSFTFREAVEDVEYEGWVPYTKRVESSSTIQEHPP